MITSQTVVDAVIRKPSTSQLLHSIPNVPCLKRHEITGRYYAVKKHRGKIKTCALKTEAGLPITDRKLAEKTLREWLDSLDNAELQRAQGNVTLGELLIRHRAVNAGMSEKTQNTIDWAINKLKNTWRGGANTPLRTIKTSDVGTWLAGLKDLKPNSFNELSRQLKNIFQLGVNDGFIQKSPYVGLLNTRKRVNKEPDQIPSPEQFQNLIDEIRGNPFSDHAEDSADLAEFLGLAGLGGAEANNLKWGDIDFEGNTISVRRVKTGAYFTVPIYPQLRTFLLALRERSENPIAKANVFKVACCKKAIAAVCKKLGYPHFTPRSLRKFGITQLIRKGINVKLIAKWQGHKDGGKLILDTYSEIISSADREFENSELAKLN
ncbi:MAG: site-specific integrase [Chthoniobacteraceae bacterium]